MTTDTVRRTPEGSKRGARKSGPTSMRGHSDTQNVACQPASACRRPHSTDTAMGHGHAPPSTGAAGAPIRTGAEPAGAGASGDGPGSNVSRTRATTVCGGSTALTSSDASASRRLRPATSRNNDAHAAASTFATGRVHCDLVARTVTARYTSCDHDAPASADSSAS